VGSRSEDVPVGIRGWFGGCVRGRGYVFCKGFVIVLGII